MRWLGSACLASFRIDAPDTGSKALLAETMAARPTFGLDPELLPRTNRDVPSVNKIYLYDRTKKC